MLLIVNADDLGASERINHAVFELMQLGVVTSATLMANGPAFEEAVRQISRFPECSFGVHLNLTAFAPLSTSRGLAAVLRNGEFCRSLLTSNIMVTLQRELEKEVTLQIQRALDAGVRVTHLDSHHFVHIRTAFFPILWRVQRKFGITRVRSPFEALSKSDWRKRLRNRAAHFVSRKCCSTIGPDGWCNFRRFDAGLCNPEFRYECLELTVHPGSDAPESVEETQFLRSDWQLRLPKHIRIGSYHSILT